MGEPGCRLLKTPQMQLPLDQEPQRRVFNRKNWAWSPCELCPLRPPQRHSQQRRHTGTLSSSDERTDTENGVHTRRGMLLGVEKEGNPAVCDDSDGPEDTVLHDIIWSHKDKCRWTPLTRTSKTAKVTESGRSMVVWGLEEGAGEQL